MSSWGGLCSLGMANDMFENYEKDKWKALHNQFVAHAMITEYAHKNYPEVKIGAMPSASFAYPYTCNPDDVIEAMKFNWHNLYFFTII